MGNILPINADKKQRIEEIAESILATFTTEYGMAYGICFLKKTMDDIAKASSAEGKMAEMYQLTHRPWDSIKKPIQFGTLTKQGAFRKNWKKRFFVVNYNYTVDYYENEEAYQKGFKPKGSISPGGYRVVSDADQGLIEKLKKMAKLLGVNEDEIPDPGEKFPDFTFELAHDKRRPYFISASNQEEKDSWIEIFKDCCYYAKGLKNEDEVGREAFKVAFRRMQYKYGSWFTIRGSEEQMLSEFIAGELEYQVMQEVYSSISGNWTIRNKIREQVCKTLDSLVMAMVTPAWGGMMEASLRSKGTMESLVKDKKDEVSAVERKVTWEIAEHISDTVQSTLAELQIEEKLKEMAESLKPVMKEALEKAKEALTKKLDEVIEKAKNCTEKIDSVLESYWDILDKLPRTYNLMFPTYKILQRITHEFPAKFYKELNFYRSDVMNIGKQYANEMVDAAVCTFEESFKKLTTEGEATKELGGSQAAELMETIKQDVLKKYDADIETTVNAFCISGAKEVIRRTVREKLDVPCKPLIKPVDKAIPDAFNKIMSVEDKYEKFVENTLFEVIRKVLGIEVPQEKDSMTEPSGAGEKNGPSDDKPTTEL